MPRYTNFDAELAKLEDALVHYPDASRQYVTRMSIELALKFIKDCKARDVLPGNRLNGIVSDYYEKGEGGLLGFLPQFASQVLQALAHQTGQSPEQVVIDLLENAGMARLERIANLRKKLDPDPKRGE